MKNTETLKMIGAVLRESLSIELGIFKAPGGEKHPAISGKGAHQYRDLLQDFEAKWDRDTKMWYFDNIEDALTAVYEISSYPDTRSEQYLERYVYKKLQLEN